MVEPAFDPVVAELRSMLDRADPVPDSVLAAAKAAFSWRTIDAELAELTADSLFADTGVRTAEGARLLTFEGPGIEVEVEVAHTGAGRKLTGQVVPVGRATRSGGSERAARRGRARADRARPARGLRPRPER